MMKEKSKAGANRGGNQTGERTKQGRRVAYR